MTALELYTALFAANNIAEIDAAIRQFENTNVGRVHWVPFGRENNRGTVEASTDPGRSLVERVTNGVDAVLEAEHGRHHGRPECRSPKDAAASWLNVPEGGLSQMTPTQRRQLAQRVTVHVTEGDGRDRRVVTIRDKGIGLTGQQMPGTILSLNETNKSRKLYLAGAYGQGGSSTLAVSRYTVIASRPDTDNRIAFTVATFYEPPLDEDKLGRYVYLTFDQRVLEIEQDGLEFQPGTLVKHFGFDLSDYPSAFGPTSLYGLLNRILFDPVMPIWLDNPVNNQRRTIKGSRNSLNGAVDGDEGDVQQQLAHSIPLYFTTLGEEFGRIGLEYWVLPRPTQDNKRPNAAFVNPTKPIILTLNGQNHAELSAAFIRKDADLPFLTQRLILHVDCNQLTPGAKRLLFVSNREDARRGVVRKLIVDEIVQTLRSDDELRRLNNEARDQGMHEGDDRARQEIRREVSRLLRLHGFNTEQPVGAVAGGDDPTVRPPGPPRPPVEVPPIQIREPPTYIQWQWDGNEPVTFHPEQRRYLRIQTDAASNYHNPRSPALSRINIVVTGEGVQNLGSTPLRGGRMRGIFEGRANAAIGAQGVIRVELSRTGLPVLTDERPFLVVPAPPTRPGTRQVALPEWDVRRVEGPESPLWTELSWPDDVTLVASQAQMEQGVLVIYYSAAFPRFRQQEQAFERRNTALATSFRTRYEIWLAVHALLVQRDQQQAPVDAAVDANGDDQEAARELRDRQERMRTAVLSAMFAAREAELPAFAGANTTIDAD